MTDASLAKLNALPHEEAREQLRRSCGTQAWLDGMAMCRPFSDVANLHVVADDCFESLSDADWLEAFGCHPKIGDINSLRMKYAGNSEWSQNEQAGMDTAAEEAIVALSKGNKDYEERFGYIFIICASGKSAAEMLAALKARLDNSPDKELPLAAAEQRKITHLRLDKLEIQ